MAIQLGRARGLRSDINVTPFVDVVLVLLIIFMVVTPMLQRGKDVRLPKAHTSESRFETELLVISMTADKRVWLNNTSYPKAELTVALRRELERTAQHKVLLKGDETLTVGDIRRVLALVRRAGAEGVTLAVQEEVTK